MSLSVVILAAGLGKRMKSQIFKPMQLLGGKPMIAYVYETAKRISDSVFIVHAKQQELVLKDALPESDCQWVCQESQLGTGHALKQVVPFLNKQKKILVLYSDAPLVNEVVLHDLINATHEKDLGLITMHTDNPSGFGRICRDKSQQFISIVEEQDASNEEKQLQEINTGIGLFPLDFLKEALLSLKNNNEKKEYYLTDIFGLAKEKNNNVHLLKVPFSPSLLGVNDKKELGELERFYQKQQAQWLQKQGVSILDADRFDCRGNVQIGKDCTIDVGVVLEGEIVLGDNCHIGPYSYLKNCTLHNNVTVASHSVLEGAILHEKAEVGPFARVRPETVIGEQAKVGNFVEIKKTTLGAGSKASHLSYLGDAVIGKAVNLGAGTITCNYNGISKKQTVIKDSAFIGSNTALVAPIEIGQQAVIAAGSVITKSVPDQCLGIGRSKQQNKTRFFRKEKD